jgi:hypothetical protein
MVKWSYQTSVNPLGFLQNWRLTEAEIDGFCHFWYEGIVGQHGSCETRLARGIHPGDVRVSDPTWFM